MSHDRRDGDRAAVQVRIASVSRDAGAHWIVIVDSTGCVEAASAWTRIATLLVDASLGRLAFAVGGAFRSAAAVALRISVEAWTTSADGIPRQTSATISVRSTRVRIAWFRYDRSCEKEIKVNYICN